MSENNIIYICVIIYIFYTVYHYKLYMYNLIEVIIWEQNVVITQRDSTQYFSCCSCYSFISKQKSEALTISIIFYLILLCIARSWCFSPKKRLLFGRYLLVIALNDNLSYCKTYDTFLTCVILLSLSPVWWFMFAESLWVVWSNTQDRHIAEHVVCSKAKTQDSVQQCSAPKRIELATAPSHDRHALFPCGSVVQACTKIFQDCCWVASDHACQARTWWQCLVSLTMLRALQIAVWYPLVN